MEPKVWIGLGARVTAWTNPAPPDAVRVGLTATGVYRISSADLATAFGVTEETVAGWLAEGLLDLDCRGETVAWQSDGDALLFFGEAPDSPLIPENVYWLHNRPGSRMADRSEPEHTPGATNATFRAQAVFYDPRDDTSYYPTAYAALTNSPFFANTSLPVGLTGGITKSWLQPLPRANRSAGTLTAEIQMLAPYATGATDSFRSEISLGTGIVSTNVMQSQQLATYSYSLAMTSLSEAALSIQIRNLNTYNDQRRLIYFVRSTVDYPRDYVADAGALLCTGGGAPWVTVTGFPDAAVFVWDVTEPKHPLMVTNLQVAASGADTVATTFACGDESKRYAAFSSDAALLLPSLRGTAFTDWEAADTQAEHVILIPPEGWFSPHRHRTLLQPLADFRTARGLRSAVIDVEQVYNRFSDGLADPRAIQRFVRFAATNWSAAPIRYLLLVGHANFDYTLKGFPLETMAHSASMIPCIPMGQQYATAYDSLGTGLALTVATDLLFGDVSGGAAPEIAVGRFPFAATNLIANAVAKTISYERGAFYARRAVTVADWHNIGAKYGNFSATVTNMTAAFSRTGREVAFLNVPPGYPDGLTTAQWEARVYPLLQARASVFYTIGHGQEGAVGANNASAVIARDRISAATWSDPVIAVLLACRVNRWQTSNANSTLSSKGLGLPSGGFAAAVGPSGYAGVDETLALSDTLVAAMEHNRPLRLGDWVVAAMAALHPVDLNEMLTLSISGDPALLLRAPTLCEALDDTNRTWTTGGSAVWVGQANTSHDGVDAAQSGAIGDREFSQIQTTVYGPGSLSFWWRVSSETNWDFLRFKVAGETWREISGEREWQNVAVKIEGSGAHTLVWEYAKDKDTAAGLDTAWVDQVAWTPVGFALWMQNRGLTSDPELAFLADRNDDGVANGFEFAFGANWVLGQPILNIRLVSGQPVIEMPSQDAETLPFVVLELKGCASLLNPDEWNLPTMAAANTTGKPAHCDWRQTVGTPSNAFFRLKAALKAE